MASSWTSEQVLALAPDDSSVKNAKKIGENKWKTFGASADLLWGECAGSGAQPYQTYIALDEPAFKCSCPSRKFPCKHGLALFLFYLQKPDQFAQKTTPNWASEWLESRQKKKEKKEQKAQEPEKPVDAKTLAKREQKQKESQQKREETVQKGIEELELWLRDLVRQGFVELKNQNYSYWDTIKRRMTDTQSTGLANRLRLMEAALGVEDWSNAFLSALARTHLLLESYRHIENLPQDLQAEVRSQIGWNWSKEEVFAHSHLVQDLWFVLAQFIEEEENLFTQKIWLYGQKSQRFAMILNFAHSTSRQSLDRSWRTGTFVPALLYFYPGRTLRVLYSKESQGSAEAFQQDALDLCLNSSADSIQEIFKQYTEAFAQNPWLSEYPMILKQVTPLCFGENFSKIALRDSQSMILPISPNFEKKGELFALTGGNPCQCFGLWDSKYFRPLSLWGEGQYWDLSL